VEKMVIKLKSDYNNLCERSKSLQDQLETMVEGHRVMIQQLNDAKVYGMTQQEALRQRVEEATGALDGALTKNRMYEHMIARIRRESMGDQAEVDEIRAELEMATKTQYGVTLRACSAKDSQHAAQEELEQKKQELALVQTGWAYELDVMRENTSGEMMVYESFDARTSNRELLLLELREQHAENMLGATEVKQTEATQSAMDSAMAQEEAVRLKQELEMLESVTGTKSLEELVGFFTEQVQHRKDIIEQRDAKEKSLQALHGKYDVELRRLEGIKYAGSSSEHFVTQDRMLNKLSALEKSEAGSSELANRASKRLALVVSGVCQLNDKLLGAAGGGPPSARELRSDSLKSVIRAASEASDEEETKAPAAGNATLEPVDESREIAFTNEVLREVNQLEQRTNSLMTMLNLHGTLMEEEPQLVLDPITPPRERIASSFSGAPVASPMPSHRPIPRVVKENVPANNMRVHTPAAVSRERNEKIYDFLRSHRTHLRQEVTTGGLVDKLTGSIEASELAHACGRMGLQVSTAELRRAVSSHQSSTSSSRDVDLNAVLQSSDDEDEDEGGPASGTKTVTMLTRDVIKARELKILRNKAKPGESATAAKSPVRRRAEPASKTKTSTGARRSSTSKENRF